MKWPALFFYCERASFSKLERIVEALLTRFLNSFRREPQLAVVACIGVIIAYLSLSPTLMLFYGSFRSKPLGVPNAEFTLAHYLYAYTDPSTYQLLFNSFVFASGSSILATGFAATLAWISIRTNAPFRKFFELTAIIPNIFPPVMLAVSWTVLLSPRTGLINRLLMQMLSLDEAPLNLYSLSGMIFVEALITTPLAFLLVSASLYSMDPSLEESARVAGSNNFQIAWRITFPIIRPALLAAVMLNFVRAIESFDTPAIIALPARIEVFTTKIYREAVGAFPPNQNLAAAYGVSLLLITMVFVYFYRSLTRRSERYVTVTGRGYRPTIIDLGKWRYPAAGLASADSLADRRAAVSGADLRFVYFLYSRTRTEDLGIADARQLPQQFDRCAHLSSAAEQSFPRHGWGNVVYAACCADGMGDNQDESCRTRGHRRFDVHSLGFSRDRARHRASLDLRLCPTADLRHAVDFIDRLHHPVPAVWPAHDDQHHRAVA